MASCCTRTLVSVEVQARKSHKKRVGGGKSKGRSPKREHVFTAPSDTHELPCPLPGQSQVPVTTLTLKRC